MSEPMTNVSHKGGVILVLEDMEETRDGIEALLNTDGYRVEPARNEREAIIEGRRQRPDLILISWRGSGGDAMAVASRVREGAELGPHVPVVVFCVETIAEGAEVEVERNVFAIRPDNFEQLRAFLHRLLD
jgi:DNA-binding response OmpR family regulator